MPPSSLPRTVPFALGSPATEWAVGSSTCRPSWARGSGGGAGHRNPERVAQARSELPDALVVPDIDALLEGWTGPRGPGHPDRLARRAGRARHRGGVALVVDKPLARTASEAQLVVDLAAHHGVPVTVFQNRRFDPELAALLAVRDRGLVGRSDGRSTAGTAGDPSPSSAGARRRPPTRGRSAPRPRQPPDRPGGHPPRRGRVGVRRALRAHHGRRGRLFLACRHTSGVVSHVMASSVNGALASGLGHGIDCVHPRPAVRRGWGLAEFENAGDAVDGSSAATRGSLDQSSARRTRRRSIARLARLCSTIRRPGCRSTRGTRSTSLPWWTRPVPVTRAQRGRGPHAGRGPLIQ